MLRGGLRWGGAQMRMKRTNCLQPADTLNTLSYACRSLVAEEMVGWWWWRWAVLKVKTVVMVMSSIELGGRNVVSVVLPFLSFLSPLFIVHCSYLCPRLVHFSPPFFHRRSSSSSHCSIFSVLRSPFDQYFFSFRF